MDGTSARGGRKVRRRLSLQKKLDEIGRTTLSGGKEGC
jgi:hypothetical protein